MTKSKKWVLSVLSLIIGLVLAAMLGIQTPERAEVCEDLRAGQLSRGVPVQQATQLAIILHGMRKTPKEIESLVSPLLETDGYQNTHIVIPSLPFGTLSTARAEDITACLVELVDREWNAKKDAGMAYDSVLLLGHSMGSLFARKLYVVARGELETAPFEKTLRMALEVAEDVKLVPSREWADKVDRIVLLGAINRGWSVDHHMPFGRVAELQAGLIVNRFVRAFNGPAFTVMSTRKGAPFITQLRLQWLEMLRCSPQPAPSGASQAEPRCPGVMPVPVAQNIVQLLGTQDDLVPPTDSIDATAGSEFKYLEVAHSDHGTVVAMAGDEPVAVERAAQFRNALNPTFEKWMQPDTVAIRSAPDPRVKHVVFVVHGIRDEGFWTERLGRRIQDRLIEQGDCAGSPARDCVRLEVSSYGFFPILSFLKPGSRDEKVEWLMDRYAEARAQYPEAKFYYVGHSHGTYLLKEALRKYESVRFERVVLAGSVLRTDHDWTGLLKNKRINGVLNLSADADWVVAFFPNALEMMGLQDLGGAGFNGFKTVDLPAFEQFPRDKRNWVRGGHGAAVAEDWWRYVADFVATGQRPMPDTALLRDKQDRAIKGISEYPARNRVMGCESRPKPLNWRFSDLSAAPGL